MRRAFALVAISALVVAGLAGCSFRDGKDTDPAAVTAAFAQATGAKKEVTKCDEASPGQFSCTITVVVDKSVTVAQLEKIFATLHQFPEAAGAITVDVHGVSAAVYDPDLDIEFNSYLAPNEQQRTQWAAAFVAALNGPSVSSIALESVSTGRADLSVISDQGTDAQLLALAKGFSDTLPGASIGVSGPTFDFATGGSSYPTVETGLFTRIAATYPVARGRVDDGVVAVQLDPTADLTAARAWVAAQPEVAELPAVTIVNDPDVDLGQSDPSELGIAPAVLAAARQFPAVIDTSTTDRQVFFTLGAASDLVDVDAALRKVHGYETLTVNYLYNGTTRAVAENEAGGVIPADVYVALAADREFSDIRVVADTGEKYSVEVSVGNGTTAVETGKLLAASGLAKLSKATIEIKSTGSVTFTTSFAAGPTIAPRVNRMLSAPQASDLARGWSEGSR